MLKGKLLKNKKKNLKKENLKVKLKLLPKDKVKKIKNKLLKVENKELLKEKKENNKNKIKLMNSNNKKVEKVRTHKKKEKRMVKVKIQNLHKQMKLEHIQVTNHIIHLIQHIIEQDFLILLLPLRILSYQVIMEEMKMKLLTKF